MGPQVRKYLWWKKYMTVIQLAQFWMIMAHTCNAIYINCGYPQGYGVALILFMVSHILLFSNFYNRAYSTTAKTIRALSPRGEKSKKSD
ncbi:hypothetical protein EB796_001640 [Bugula neritina]|uniref:Very-long-chain 3-oxoacyl-CoA synthase n=1 Tax=Bugula neritina TaxID=10212 RepID=A0A7J7KPG2_BUGNE|nr:hypothetical protein EB796_001640 [Bugula neritina]